MNKREAMKKEETIMKLNINKTLHSDSVKNLKGTKSLGLEKYSNEARLALIILYNVYNIESSNLMEFFKSFKFVEELPFFLWISKDFLNLLEGDYVHREILALRDKMMSDFDKLHLDIEENWTPEQKAQFLNDRSNIDISDWVFVYSLILRKAWNLNNVLYLVPGANFAGFKLSIKSDADYNEIQTTFGNSHIKTYDNSIYLLALEEVLFGGMITDFYGKPYYFNSLFLYNVKEKNPSECIQLALVSKDYFDKMTDKKKMVLKSIGVFSNKICLATFETSLKGFEVYRKVLKMSDQDAANCVETLMMNPVPDQKSRISVVLTDCKDTKENSDFKGEEIYAQADEMVKELEKKLEKVGEIEENKGLEAEMVKFYLEDRKKLAEKVREFVGKKIGIKKDETKNEL